MKDQDLKRVTRLTAMLLVLQTKRLLTATELSERFSVSVRTIYRDIRALEQAGVPVLTEEGKGYSLMDGFRVPPVMFSEEEANALVTAEQLVLKSKDLSLRHAYVSAVEKVKAILKYRTKEKVALLSERIAVSPAALNASSTGSLMQIQSALTDYRVLAIVYHSTGNAEPTAREIEPFAFYYSQGENWLLIAYCRWRKDYRMFRLDRISSLKTLDEKFSPHQLTLAAYIAEKRKKFSTPDNTLS